ncbi:hypothetical protein K491DRAFT_605687 [Lophiostoma macrostomum CBS 122681]|uniref:Uncharacterized protein n=1 Tax=Lophiostoma macrostomum CBS 122681 TaxID=1314788 RepID=A0A6A6T0J5_9PLEO|nr:hypothetical protein K491DRAFT_605687 [Lophiostoma macrostomum CBS 122681]
MPAPQCNHTYQRIKSDSNLILWRCSACHSGPHWWIYQCTQCRTVRCQNCTNKP